MAASLTHMFPAPKHLTTWILAPELPHEALPLLHCLLTQTPVQPLHPARRTVALVASFSATVGPTFQNSRTLATTGEFLESAPPDITVATTEATGADELWAGRTGTRVAEEEAGVAAIPPESAPADFATGMGEDPRIGNWVFGFSAET